jgi:hypothetical protein
MCLDGINSLGSGRILGAGLLCETAIVFLAWFSRWKRTAWLHEFSGFVMTSSVCVKSKFLDTSVLHGYCTAVVDWLGLTLCSPNHYHC